MGAGRSVDSWRLVAGPSDPPPRHDRPERPGEPGGLLRRDPRGDRRSQAEALTDLLWHGMRHRRN
jgi:hypothetical protein